jgi:hypothetical protein
MVKRRQVKRVKVFIVINKNMKEFLVIVTSLSLLGAIIAVAPQKKKPKPKPTSFSPKKRKRYIESCPGDGNCLFCAIGVSVNKDHMTVRRSIVREMWKNKNRYEPFFTPRQLNNESNVDLIDKIDASYSSYLHRMLKKGQWGGEMEIVAASNVYKRPITVFSEKDAAKYFNEDTYLSSPIEIFYNGSSHYDSVVT